MNWYVPCPKKDERIRELLLRFHCNCIICSEFMGSIHDIMYSQKGRDNKETTAEVSLQLHYLQQVNE